ncbi:MAG: hypothetical protein Q4G04_02635 [bacterium]|nr:hypothetical protein [bacterium]
MNERAFWQRIESMLGSTYGKYYAHVCYDNNEWPDFFQSELNDVEKEQINNLISELQPFIKSDIETPSKNAEGDIILTVSDDGFERFKGYCYQLGLSNVCALRDFIKQVVHVDNFEDNAQNYHDNDIGKKVFIEMMARLGKFLNPIVFVKGFTNNNELNVETDELRLTKKLKKLSDTRVNGEFVMPSFHGRSRR